MNAGPMRILQEFAENTGGFRVNKQGAADLAAAIVAVAETVDDMRAFVSDHAHGLDPDISRLKAALARIGADA